MKVLHVNTSRYGGAGTAAFRLHKALCNNTSIQSNFITCSEVEKQSQAKLNHYGDFLLPTKPKYPILTLKNYFKEKIFKTYTREYKKYLSATTNYSNYKKKIAVNTNIKFEIFSPPYSCFDITMTNEYKNADIIHLHWISGLLDYNSFFKKNTKPIVWTLHDENPYKGAFHYENDERNNIDEFFNKNKAYLDIKNESYKNQDRICFVSPSKWLQKKAQNSNILKSKQVVTIPNTLDTHVFKPLDKQFCREVLNISFYKTVFLFVSQDIHNYRKGYDLLYPLIRENDFKDCIFLIVGKRSNKKKVNENIIFVDNITDERLMSIIYNSADFFITPSREDNFPNTTIESLCCGTPVIAFPIGDNNELLKHNNGIISNDISTQSLKNAMVQAKQKQAIFNKNNISKYAQQLCNPKIIASEYLKIYNSLL